MSRRRIYNPAQLTPEELAASFVARRYELGEMLRILREQPPDRPCQHFLIIGARGMGKTTLGLRFLHEVEADPALSADWQPVPFHEESYGIADIGDLWLTALRHLADAAGAGKWADIADTLSRNENDADRRAAYALDSLLDFRAETGKRLLLFVENLDMIIAQMRDERANHALRAALMTCPDILFMGSACAVFPAIRDYNEALYQFFRLFILDGIDAGESRDILETIAAAENRTDISDTLNSDAGRLEIIRRLTGGNPRLIVLACHLLIDSPAGAAFQALERLIDEQTPYFKALIEQLPPQARKVFHCLAAQWTPMLAREIAGAAHLSSSHVSAQLKLLVEKSYVREIDFPEEKRTRYEVADRTYNTYHLMRFAHGSCARLERLVSFLHDLSGARATEMTQPSTAALAVGEGDPLMNTHDLYALPPAPAGGSLNPETLVNVERYLLAVGEKLDPAERRWAIRSMTAAAGAGHAAWAKQTLETAGLASSMEPLWRALGAELGEKPEPLPAEIAAAVADLRTDIANTKTGAAPRPANPPPS